MHACMNNIYCLPYSLLSINAVLYVRQKYYIMMWWLTERMFQQLQNKVLMQFISLIIFFLSFLIDWLINWLISWLNNWLFFCLIDWLIGCRREGRSAVPRPPTWVSVWTELSFLSGKLYKDGTYGRTHVRTSRWTHVRTHGSTNRRTHEGFIELMEELMERLMEGVTKGLM